MLAPLSPRPPGVRSHARRLAQPLGFPPGLTHPEMLRHIGRLNLPDHEGFIHFSQTLTAAANLAAGVPVPLCASRGKPGP